MKSKKLVSLTDMLGIPAGSVWTVEAFMEYPAESSTPAFIRIVIHVDGHQTMIQLEGDTARKVKAQSIKYFSPFLM